MIGAERTMGRPWKRGRPAAFLGHRLRSPCPGYGEAGRDTGEVSAGS